MPDSYDLSREVAAVSLNLFDRYMATKGNRCDGETALLTSLTTLYIAVKTHASYVKMSLSTLANLSRGQYSEQDIEAMEWKILPALKWKLHPPTTHLFVKYMLLFVPPETPKDVKTGLFELANYVAELALCDSSLVNVKNSTIAFSAILNVLEDVRSHLFTPTMRAKFLAYLAYRAGAFPYTAEVVQTRVRLRRSYEASMAANGPLDVLSEGYHGRDLQDSTSVADNTIMSASTHGSCKSFLSDSKGSCRFSNASPLRHHLIHTVSPISRAVRSLAGVP